jgi:hypothetical protein
MDISLCDHTAKARPLQKTYHSAIQWKLELTKGKLRIGDVLQIEAIVQRKDVINEEEHGLFGKCRLAEIHNFWGRYAIVSMVKVEEGMQEDLSTHFMFWIESIFLHVPENQVQAAYQERLLHPFAVLHVI